MTANYVKKQHFVPRTYLKHFANERSGEYYICALPKNAIKATDIYETNIKKICAKKDVYTLPGETIEEKMLIENFYSNNLENDYDNIYRILLDSEKRTITIKEKSLIVSTVITMLFRTTKLVNAYNEFEERDLDYIYSVC